MSGSRPLWKWVLLWIVALALLAFFVAAAVILGMPRV